MTTPNFINEAITSFKECQRIVKHPTNEAEYIEWVIPHDGESISKTWDNVQTKATELETEWNAKEYARKRAIEYPNMEEQLDDIYHNGIEGWKTSIAVIKNKYPK